MIRRERIIYDNVAQPQDLVNFAVMAIDSFTGEVISEGVKVELLDQNNANKPLPFLPRENLSGMRVFVNLPNQAFYRIRLSAKDAGYFDPAIFDHIPPAANDPLLIQKRRVEFYLHRRAEHAVNLQATVVAGVIERNGSAVENAEINAEIPPALVPPALLPLSPFVTRSDERGAFAIPLRLPEDATTGPVAITFTMQEGADQRQFVRNVEERHFYSFEQPVDLTGNAATNNPPLIQFGA